MRWLIAYVLIGATFGSGVADTYNKHTSRAANMIVGAFIGVPTMIVESGRSYGEYLTTKEQTEKVRPRDA